MQGIVQGNFKAFAPRALALISKLGLGNRLKLDQIGHQLKPTVQMAVISH